MANTEFLEGLKTFLRIPSVSTLEEHKSDVQKAADFVATELRRIGMENVVAPMPPMGPIIATDDDLWRILAFIRANFRGAPENKFGQAPEANP